MSTNWKKMLCVMAIALVLVTSIPATAYAVTWDEYLAILKTLNINDSEIAPRKAMWDKWSEVERQNAYDNAKNEAGAGKDWSVNQATCDWMKGYTFTGCIWRPLLSALGALLLSTIGGALAMVSNGFNWVFIHTVTELGTTLKDLKIYDGVQTAWGAFRDISNIVIIGMLTFMAIATILGSQTYGYRQLLAKVLLVAVLINFSLFFSTIIIDASNFVSAQFYKSIQSVTGAPAAGGGSGAAAIDSSRNGVAGAFLGYMGIGSIWDNTKQLQKLGDDSNNSWVIIGYALMASLLMIGVMIVLLYASWLMLSRAVLLVFLMLVSSLAFASYLIPNLSNSGWKRWWDTLLQASFFGPLLTIFLWASLLILSKAGASSQGTSWGKIIESGGTSADVAGVAWKTVIMFAFVVGFLYASIRAAHSLSGSIAGMTTVQKGISATGVTALATVSRPFGFLARNTLGKAAAAGREAMRERGWSDSKMGLQAMRLMDKGAKSSFDVASTKPIQGAAKVAGVDAIIGKEIGKGGVEATRDQQAKRSLEDAQKFGPKTEAQKAPIREEATKEELRKQQPERQNIEAIIDREREKAVQAPELGAKKEQEIIRQQAPERQALEVEMKPHKEKIETVKREREEKERDYSRDREILSQQIVQARVNNNNAQANTFSAQLASLEQRRQEEFRDEENRISEATAHLKPHQESLNRLDRTARLEGEKEAKRIKDEAEKNIKSQEKKLEGLNKEAEDAGRAAADGTRLAQKLAMSRPGTLYGLFRRDPKNDPVASRIPGVYKSQAGKRRVKEIATELKTETEENK